MIERTYLDDLSGTLRQFKGGGVVVASPVVHRVMEDGDDPVGHGEMQAGDILHYYFLISGPDDHKIRVNGDDYDVVNDARDDTIAGLRARGFTVYDFDTEVAAFQQCHIEWPSNTTRRLVVGIVREEAGVWGRGDRFLYMSEGRAPGYSLLTLPDGRTIELKQVNGILQRVREAA